MNLKSFFKLKFILFSIIAVILTGLLLRGSYIYNPIFWFTLVPSSPPGPDVGCFLAIVDRSFGWPLSFLRVYGANSCEINTRLNLVSLLLNFAAFLIIGKIIFRKKTDTTIAN